jgi:hypothetical protein
VVSSASIGRNTTLSPKGINFILKLTPCSTLQHKKYKTANEPSQTISKAINDKKIIQSNKAKELAISFQRTLFLMATN